MEDMVVTSEKPSTTFEASATIKIICRVCQKQFSKYTCPRCNSRYCNLQCYKLHSARCTESFMRDNVLNEMQHMRPDVDTKQKMLHLLKRFHSEETQMMESMNEDQVFSTLSEETIDKILAGDQVGLDDLSAEEKKRFQRAIASGELSKLIEPWEPWWLKTSARAIRLSRDGTRLVKPVCDKDSVEDGHSSDIPAGPEIPLPPITKLSSKSPSPLLPIHLVDIMYTYCFTLRIYNGEWKSDALGAGIVMLSLSYVLGEGGQPETVSQALAYCLEQTCSPSYRHSGGLQFGLGLVDDVISLLDLGHPALVCLLSHLQRLIQAAEREIESEKPRKQKRVEIKHKLKLADRKVQFLMCWVHEQPGEAWSSLAAIVGVEKKSIVETYHADGRKPVKADGKESNDKGGLVNPLF